MLRVFGFVKIARIGFQIDCFKTIQSEQNHMHIFDTYLFIDLIVTLYPSF